MKPCLTVLTVIVIASIACRTRQDESRLKWINESLVNSNEVIANQTSRIYESLQQKMRDPRQFNSRIWGPKADTIQQATKDILTYIDSLKIAINNQTGNRLFEELEKTKELSGRLANYKKDVLGVFKPAAYAHNVWLHTQMIKDLQGFDRSLPLNADLLTDTTKIPSFKDATVLTALTLLNKIENDVRITEQTLAAYCSMLGITSYCGFTLDMPMAVQSSHCLKSGQLLEITAGVGVFSREANPRIMINGISVPVESEGVGVYHLRAPKKPGEYTVPISMEYSKSDGSKVMVHKKITFTVAP
jgi:hypothetical protein